MAEGVLVDGEGDINDIYSERKVEGEMKGKGTCTYFLGANLLRLHGKL